MLKRSFNRLMSALGRDGLSREYQIVTLVHVLLMLGTGLSSVFISVFLFKMNGSDYVLTAKYNAVLFLFESLTFILCLFVYKFLDVVKTMQVGLCFYAFSYIVLLIFKSNIVNYYILVALLSSIGAGLYWTGYYLLMNEHTTPFNRQKALGFNGSCCYIVSVIVSPISGLVTSAFVGMTGYVIIFVITIVVFLLGAFYIRTVPYSSTGSYKFRFLNSFKYLMRKKSTRIIYISEIFRGIRVGMTYYYTPILLYSITSNEFILGLSLMMKHLSSIVCCNYMKNIKNAKQRLVSTALLLGIEIVALVFIVVKFDANFMIFIIFLYCSFYVLSDILGTNLSQIPLFESMVLLKRDCGSDREFMSVRQLLFGSGRTFGVLVLLFLPTTPVFQLTALACSSVAAFLGSLLCNKGAKLISKEV